jgi:hypothetical protein
MAVLLLVQSQHTNNPLPPKKQKSKKKAKTKKYAHGDGGLAARDNTVQHTNTPSHTYTKQTKKNTHRDGGLAARDGQGPLRVEALEHAHLVPIVLVVCVCVCVCVVGVGLDGGVWVWVVGRGG